ncbi:unnamed protein product [Caenorhabditis nigoni]
MDQLEEVRRQIMNLQQVLDDAVMHFDAIEDGVDLHVELAAFALQQIEGILNVCLGIVNRLLRPNNHQ